MAARPAKGICSVCRAAVVPKSRFVPFCSERCKMVDLGRWFTGEYVVAGEDAIAIDPEELEEHLRRIEADRARKLAEGGDAEDDA
jgi:endogenous inhibitor of DNA gyrase (YacG/DUF329 family)